MTAVDFRALVESTVDMVAVFDREHRYVYVNAAFERATGVRAADVLGKLAAESRAPGDVGMWRAAIADVLANNTQRVIEHVLETPRGRRRFASVIVAAGEHVCAFSRDVTDVQAMRVTSYLAKAGAILERFDPRTSLQSIVELAVPELADRAFIHLRTTSAPITVAVAPPERATMGPIGAPRSIPDDSPIARVLAGGPAELVHVDDATLARVAKDGDELAYLRAQAYRSVVVAPMIGKGGVLGTISFTTGESGRRFDETDLEMLAELARRTGIALDNARLYEALRESDEQLRTALSAARAGTWRLDLTTMRTKRDPSYARMLGIPPGTQLAANLGGVHPDDEDVARRAFEQTVAEGVPYTPEMRVQRGDGTYIWTRTHARLLRDDDGRPAVLTGITFDIDEARRANEVSETLYRLGVSFARELDHDRLVQRITEEVVALVGADGGAFWYQLDSLPQTIQVGAADGIPLPPSRGRQRIDDVTGDPRFRGSPLRSYLAVPISGVTGEPFGVLLLGHREPGHFTDDHERLVTGIANHATVALENARLYRAVRERERQLVTAVARARDADRRKDEFLAMLGHELRNPLAPITTALDLLEMKNTEIGQRERGIIRRHVEHMTRLVDDLLDVSRITRGRLELAKEAVELSTVIARAIEMASPLLEPKHQTLAVEVAREGLLVDADPVRLGQVFENLLINASKYSGPRTAIEIAARETGDAIVVEIRDHGAGIAPELLPQLFDMFVQGKRTIDRAEGGLGIGLTIARSLCELHGGTIAARSDGPGTGSTFSVTLPRAALPAQPRSERRTEPMPKLVRGMRVLVVDDNVDAARMLQGYLAELGHEPAIAHDAPTALELAATFRPDIAVLDIGLPVMNGYELARKLRERLGPDVLRLIAMSGYGDAADHARVADAGFDHHLVKPIALDALTILLGK